MENVLGLLVGLKDSRSAISSSRVLLTGKGDMISKEVGGMLSGAEAMHHCC